MVIVGNTVFRGKDTSKYAKLLRVTGNLQAYLRDNIEFDQDMLSIQPVIDDYKEMREPPKLEKFVDIQPADQALKSLWNKVGARPWDRDEIDLRIIEQAKNGKTRMIDLEPEQRISRDPVARKQFDIEDWDQCMDRRLIKGSEPI